MQQRVSLAVLRRAVSNDPQARRPYPHGAPAPEPTYNRRFLDYVLRASGMTIAEPVEARLDAYIESVRAGFTVMLGNVINDLIVMTLDSPMRWQRSRMFHARANTVRMNMLSGLHPIHDPELDAAEQLGRIDFRFLNRLGLLYSNVRVALDVNDPTWTTCGASGYYHVYSAAVMTHDAEHAYTGLTLAAHLLHDLSVLPRTLNAADQEGKSPSRDIVHGLTALVVLESPESTLDTAPLRASSIADAWRLNYLEDLRIIALSYLGSAHTLRYHGAHDTLRVFLHMTKEQSLDSNDRITMPVTVVDEQSWTPRHWDMFCVARGTLSLAQILDTAFTLTVVTLLSRKFDLWSIYTLVDTLLAMYICAVNHRAPLTPIELAWYRYLVPQLECMDHFMRVTGIAVEPHRFAAGDLSDCKSLGLEYLEAYYSWRVAFTRKDAKQALESQQEEERLQDYRVPGQARWNCSGLLFSMTKEHCEWMAGATSGIAQDDIAGMRLFYPEDVALRTQQRRGPSGKRKAPSSNAKSRKSTSEYKKATEVEPSATVQKAWLRSAKHMESEVAIWRGRFSVPHESAIRVSSSGFARMFRGGCRTPLFLYPLGQCTRATSIDNLLVEKILGCARAIGTSSHSSIAGSIRETHDSDAKHASEDGPPCLMGLPVHRSPCVASGSMPSVMNRVMGLDVWPHTALGVLRYGIGAHFAKAHNEEMSTMYESPAVSSQDVLFPDRPDRSRSKPSNVQTTKKTTKKPKKAAKAEKAAVKAENAAAAAAKQRSDQWEGFRPEFFLYKDNLAMVLQYQLFFPSERLARMTRASKVMMQARLDGVHLPDGCITTSTAFHIYRTRMMEQIRNTYSIYPIGDKLQKTPNVPRDPFSLKPRGLLIVTSMPIPMPVHG